MQKISKLEKLIQILTWALVALSLLFFVAISSLGVLFLTNPELFMVIMRADH